MEPFAYAGQLTPVEKRGGAWFKRDDLFVAAGAPGGKARTCWGLAQGAVGLVTAGSRQSPQVGIVARIAAHLGVPFRAHTPQGKLAPELELAKSIGAEIVQHRAGYNSVIVARAREDAAARGWTEIPFGMECVAAVRATAGQCANLPPGRLVVPVGSGMSLAGILHGLRERGDERPVLGVVVGADPERRLDKYAPGGWRRQVTLQRSALDYHAHPPVQHWHGLLLDPVYEAKCIPFIRPDDVVWLVGIRGTSVAE